MLPGHDSQAGEANWIAGQIKALHETGIPYRDMAVLYRSPLCGPGRGGGSAPGKSSFHTIYSGTRFFDHMEIKDALSYLRMSAYQDDLSFLRVANIPKRNLGKRRIAFLREYAQQEDAPCDQALRDNETESLFKSTKASSFLSLIDAFSSGYEGRPVSRCSPPFWMKAAMKKNAPYRRQPRAAGQFSGLKQSVYEYETTCGEEVTLEALPGPYSPVYQHGRGPDRGQGQADDCPCRQGLGNSPYVFLCGMNEGIFPSRKVRTLPGMEGRTAAGFRGPDPGGTGTLPVRFQRAELRQLSCYPSRFLLDINQALLTFPFPPQEGAYPCGKGLH